MIDMQVQGLDELDRQFNRLIDTAKRKTMQKALNAGVAPIKKEAKRLAPVDSGLMKSQIRSKQLKQTKYPAVGIYIKVKSRADAYYWQFVEKGTSNMVAQPFMRPASDSKHEEGIEKFKVKLRTEIDRITT